MSHNTSTVKGLMRAVKSDARELRAGLDDNTELRGFDREGNPVVIQTANNKNAILQVYIPQNHTSRIDTAEWRAFVAEIEEEEEVIIQELPVAGWKGR